MEDCIPVCQIVRDLSKQLFSLKQIMLFSVDSYKYIKLFNAFS